MIRFSDHANGVVMPELPHWTVKDCPCYHRYLLTCWKHLLTILQCANNPARLLICSWVALSRDSPNDTICNKPADNRSSKEIVADPLVPCNFLPRQFLQCNEPVRGNHGVMMNFSWCENELMKDILGSFLVLNIYSCKVDHHDNQTSLEALGHGCLK